MWPQMTARDRGKEPPARKRELPKRDSKIAAGATRGLGWGQAEKEEVYGFLTHRAVLQNLLAKSGALFVALCD